MNNNILFINIIIKQVPNFIKLITLSKGNIIVYIKKEALLPFFYYIKYNAILKFAILSDLFAVDYPDRENRFELIYNLISTDFGCRVIIKVSLAGSESLPSISSIFNSANWLEREVWDMYGIFFDNHPDLRRILTDYGFEGYPLRKDFPLSGYKEVRYDDEQKKVVLEPLEVSQEFRCFDFVSPWENFN